MQINLTSTHKQMQNGTPQSLNKSKQQQSPHSNYDGCPETPNLGVNMEHQPTQVSNVPPQPQNQLMESIQVVTAINPVSNLVPVENANKSSQDPASGDTPDKNQDGSNQSEQNNSQKRNFKPGPKARRDKKHVTAAQNQGKVTGRWTDLEHKRFKQAIRIYGKDWKKVTAYVGTRISAQVRSHAQKVLKDYSPNTPYDEKVQFIDDSSEEEPHEVKSFQGEIQGKQSASDSVKGLIDDKQKHERTDDLNYAVNALDVKLAPQRRKIEQKSTFAKVGQKRQRGDSDDLPRMINKLNPAQSVTSNSSDNNQNNCQTFNQQSDQLLKVAKPSENRPLSTQGQPHQDNSSNLNQGKDQYSNKAGYENGVPTAQRSQFGAEPFARLMQMRIAQQRQEFPSHTNVTIKGDASRFQPTQHLNGTGAPLSSILSQGLAHNASSQQQLHAQQQQQQSSQLQNQPNQAAPQNNFFKGIQTIYNPQTVGQSTQYMTRNTLYANSGHLQQSVQSTPAQMAAHQPTSQPPTKVVKPNVIRMAVQNLADKKSSDFSCSESVLGLNEGSGRDSSSNHSAKKFASDAELFESVLWPVTQALDQIVEKRIELLRMIHGSQSKPLTSDRQRLTSETVANNERIINEVIRLKKVMTSLIEEFQAIVERNNLKNLNESILNRYEHKVNLMEIEIFYLQQQVERNVNLLLKEVQSGRHSPSVQERHAVASHHSAEKEKEDQFASQVSFGIQAMRKESFDKDYDTKTAENTNQKEFTLGEMLKNHVMKKMNETKAADQSKKAPQPGHTQAQAQGNPNILSNLQKMQARNPQVLANLSNLSVNPTGVEVQHLPQKTPNVNFIGQGSQQMAASGAYNFVPNHANYGNIKQTIQSILGEAQGGGHGSLIGTMNRPKVYNFSQASNNQQKQ